MKMRYVYSNGERTFARTFNLNDIEIGCHIDEICDCRLLRDFKIVDKVQWTGMIDCDGVEIYDGDYVTNGSIEFFEVAYQAPAFVMKKHTKKGLSKTWQSFTRKPTDKQFQKVVGNRFGIEI